MVIQPPPLIIGNWKMNGTQAIAASLVRKLQLTQHEFGPYTIVLCPPFTLLTTIFSLLNGKQLALGAQDCHTESTGAYTGDISAEMIKDTGCLYVILGHSERRQFHNETNAQIKKKAATALVAGLIPVICIGESAKEREDGKTLDSLKSQLINAIPSSATPENTVIAYEPLWAIGTGKTATTSEIAEAHRFISDTMQQKYHGQFRVLYGGSVKPENTASILATEGVSGLLVGGCSLSADDFTHIIRIATQSPHWNRPYEPSPAA